MKNIRQLCNVYRLGQLEYGKAWNLQKALVKQISEGKRQSALLLLEHNHVYTIGRTGSMADINTSEESLLNLGLSIYETDRGGQVTYHGPGQLIAYPIINIRALGGPHKYIRALEASIIKTLSDHNISGLTKDGQTGVWVADEKIAAIGVKISRGISFHGVSLNINPNLGYFKHIIPCGLAGKHITSMESTLAKPMNVDAVSYSLQYYLGKELDLILIDSDPAELPDLD